jgi:peptide/nickel transport system substrate-binding protein
LSHDAPIAIANRTNFRDARFGELFLSALKLFPVEPRIPLVHEAQEIQHERGGLIIWGFVNAVDVVSHRIGGVEVEHSHFPTWRFERIWVG